jgi:hypothetical protein
MHWIDPESLPETKGKVERFITTPHGDVDGLVLNGGSGQPVLVHVPPHMGGEVVTRVKAGDSVGVRGVRPRGSPMIAAVAITTGDGIEVVDAGPEDKRQQKLRNKLPEPDWLGEITVAGTVRLSLFAPKGELRGALLDDGSIVRIGPKEAGRFAKLLQPGAAVAVTGEGSETEYGIVVEGRKIGSDLKHMKSAKGPKHRH